MASKRTALSSKGPLFHIGHFSPRSVVSSPRQEPRFARPGSETRLRTQCGRSPSPHNIRFASFCGDPANGCALFKTGFAYLASRPQPFTVRAMRSCSRASLGWAPLPKSKIWTTPHRGAAPIRSDCSRFGFPGTLRSVFRLPCRLPSAKAPFLQRKGMIRESAFMALTPSTRRSRCPWNRASG